MGLSHGKGKSWSWSLIIDGPVLHSLDPRQGVSLAGSAAVPALSGQHDLDRDPFLPCSGCSRCRQPGHRVSR
jgi:hypothetical protein